MSRLFLKVVSQPLHLIFTNVDCLRYDPHHAAMRAIIMYVIGVAASLAILGYTVHMFLGGIVTPATEQIITLIVICLGAIAIFWMTWDILRRR